MTAGWDSDARSYPIGYHGPGRDPGHQPESELEVPAG